MEGGGGGIQAIATGTPMPRRHRINSLLLVLFSCGLILTLHLLGFQGGQVQPAGKAAPAADPWREIDRLLSEQKFEEAAAAVQKIRLSAQKQGNEPEWTRALIQEVQLRTGLHGNETAVRFLKEQDWPDGILNRSILNLFYAQSLVNYYNMYSWEISRREKVESSKSMDLKAWTKDQIYAEAQKAFLEVWRQRELLGKEKQERWQQYLDKNNYPAGIRPSLRDAVSYLYADLFANSQFWRPEEANETYRLSFKDLILRPSAGRSAEPVLSDGAAHPLVKLSAILLDLESWHASAGRKEAALESRLVRYQKLHGSIIEPDDRNWMIARLEADLKEAGDLPWSAAGKAQLAEFIRDSNRPSKLIQARAVADQGLKAFPQSVGGRRCAYIIRSIEAPDFSLAAMSSDGFRKRSIAVTHKNLSALYLRAFPMDLENRIRTSNDYNLLPDQREQLAWIKAQKPAAEWKADLAPTPDYEEHRTYVTLPAVPAGLYIIAASAKPDFAAGEGNRILGVNLILSDIVLTANITADGGIEARASEGETGKAVAGVPISLYRRDWRKPHQKSSEQTTDENGWARMQFPADGSGASYFLLAKKGNSFALSMDGLYYYSQAPAPSAASALVYTDRSVYRPLQKILWKVLVFSGSREQGQYQAAPAVSATVSLMDPNGEKVDSKIVSTNSFGTAAGEFPIPPGRLLGNWRVACSPAGNAYIKVEEYKRPTFEVTLEDSAQALRLNRPVQISGSAKYYFGLPVINGNIKWRVTREEVYPWWWEWGRRNVRPARSQTIAAGSSSPGADGKFSISFTPEADERGADAKDISYRYTIDADLTDEGGETRSASKSFRLGFVSVEANIGFENEFAVAQGEFPVAISRTDLNGAPRPGTGSWRLTALSQPSTTLPPADLPAPGAGREESFATPGDKMRPRWQTDYLPQSEMRRWSDGAEIKRGELKHEANGRASLKLSGLSAGAYRIHYSTLDDFGAPFSVSREFVVAGPGLTVALPALLMSEKHSFRQGEKARFLAASGLPGQEFLFEIWRNGKLVQRQVRASGKDGSIIEVPITPEDRGGFCVRMTLLRDYQILRQDQSVYVPWEDKELKIQFSSFRDRLRPGAKETWRVTVQGPSGKTVDAGAAELLAYMYDRSLDIFGPHNPPVISSLYPGKAFFGRVIGSLGQTSGQWMAGELYRLPDYPVLQQDRLKFLEGYGIGGPGRRYMAKAGIAGGVVGGVLNEAMSASPAPAMMASRMDASDAVKEKSEEGKLAKAPAPPPPPGANEAQQPSAQLRSDFAETAFWVPQLLTGEDGSASIEFKVPDSVTAWNVWVHAVTRDLTGGSLTREARSVKDLMTRPYLPRFLREGDLASLKVVVNNASDHDFKGQLTLDVIDPESGKSVLDSFGLNPEQARLPFSVVAGGGANLSFQIKTPAKVGTVAFKVVAAADDQSDGELRPIPILPGRMHLSQSRFVTLKNSNRRTMTFEDLKRSDDPTRINEQMVVTLDAQLFYSVLSSLPYLVNYPYECTEQTLNRFISSGILSGLYRKYPAVDRMAREFAKRQTPLETWDQADPNRKMSLEETPWLMEARGGTDAGFGMTNVLDPRIAAAEKATALAKLKKAQTASGGFPWWPGGPPSPYMTLYIMFGFAKASEFGIEIPNDVVQRGWKYLALHYREEFARRLLKNDCCWEFLTFLNYVASCYPDPSVMGDALTAKERKEILDFCFKHWRQHSPYLKCQLALTLRRMNRAPDAALVFASVMDSAKSTEDEGTFWAPEDRSWLWYNDTIETHAMALRTLMEITPENPKKDGLVQWLFLNKKLNHWKSTRATAEVIYSLVHYLEKEGGMVQRETATVLAGRQETRYVFEPDQYTGKKNQIVVPGDRMDARDAAVVVEKEGKGFMFASATWHFSTEKLPEKAAGDFLSVSRSFFKRENTGVGYALKPLAEGAALTPGDQVEVHLSIRAKHACEYVHLRDPRAAGLEPENAVSRFKWDLGIGWYEETRDAATNFFFESLPAGEYTFKYRVRANMAGTFKVGPATLQSMYAPEFNAYSEGAVVTIH
jgi:alpha-2-macroglobulin